jgi:hypothetical protein
MFRAMTSGSQTSNPRLLLPLAAALFGACAANLLLVWSWL